MTLALIKQQMASKEIRSNKSVDKWKVFRDACEARVRLGLQDRALAVLNALLSFYPETYLRQGDALIVFPSNAQLSIRAHGIAGATLRRHLATLVDAGLIIRKDSANGKRYVRKDRAGAIADAFGFDLSPLLVRSEELAQMAQQLAADHAMLRRTKEALTIRRRDARKLISAAIEEGASGDWGKIQDIYQALVARIPRSPTVRDLAPILEEMDLLCTEIVNQLDLLDNSENVSSNDVQFERHIQNSHTESLNEIEPGSGNELEAKIEPEKRPSAEPPKAFPLSMVMRACPEVAMYAPGGAISSWRDLMATAVVVRSMLGVSPNAYQDACEVMGPENAAVAVACILERAGHINSAGGYLRDLTSKALRSEFSLGPMLMALLRANGSAERRVG